MSSGRRLLAGAAWTYGSQILVVVLQFAYAAVTSRVLDDGAFGAYAIALSVTGFVTLLATGGLGQSVGRMVEIERTRIRSLATYGALLGVIAGTFTLLTATFWATLWGAPEAVSSIQLFSLSALIAPLLGLATGLARRLGRFKQLSLLSLSANVLGMSIGVLVVIASRSSIALLVFPLIAQLCTLVFAFFITDRHLYGLASLRGARHDVVYSWKLTAASVLSYGVGSLTRIGVSRVLGPSVLGQWNRADVVGAVPFQQAQAAIIPVIYPEFRHDINDATRARSAWTDMLVLVAWIAIPLGAIAAIVVPVITPVLFGPGWELAIYLAPFVCAAGAIQMVTTLLASAIEALGWFRLIWLTQASLLMLQVCAVLLLVWSENIVAVMVALVATPIVQHAVYVFAAARRGYVDGVGLLINYAIVCAVAAVVCLATWAELTLVRLIGEGVGLALLGGLVLPIVVALCIWLWPARWPPVAIARRRGFWPGGAAR